MIKGVDTFRFADKPLFKKDPLALCDDHMCKARHLKTFPQATYQKINFSLDHFLQLYFKI